MSHNLAIATQKKTDDSYELERDLARAKGQLLAVIGSGQVAAVANNDFRREVRGLLERGELTAQRFEELEDVLDHELEQLSAGAEQLLDEELRAVLP